MTWLPTKIPGRNTEEKEDEDFIEDESQNEIDSFPTLDDIDDEVETSTEEDDVEETETETEEVEEKEEATDSTEKDETKISSSQSQKKSEERKDFGNRAQKRIQKLAQQKNAYKAQIETLQKQIHTERTTKVEAQKADKESKKVYLDEQVDTYSNQMREAMELSDSDKFIEAQKKFQTASMQRMAIDSVKIEDVPSEEEYLKENTIKENAPEISEEGYKWVQKHGNILKGNPLYQQVAVAADEQLKAEGWDDTSPEYYQELDNRLGKHLVAFQSKDEEENSVTRKGKPTSQRKQIVSGKATTPAKRKANGLPILSASEKQVAADLNISEKAYAKQKLKYEKSSGTAYISVNT